MAKQLSDNPDYDSIIDSLLLKTTRGKIPWEVSSKPSLFVAKLGDDFRFETFLYIVRAGGINAAHVLRMLGPDDRTVFAVSTTTPGLSDEYRERISEIYELARRTAYQIDSSINEALKLLKKS